jgi:hypothetical protein
MPDLKSELQRIAPRIVPAPSREDLVRQTPPPPATAQRPRPVDLGSQVRELTLADGRKLTADRRAMSWVAEGEADADGRRGAVIAWRMLGKPTAVSQSYQDVRAWWLGSKETQRP